LDKVKIYTDGACRGNPGPGGWGILLILGKHEKTLCGGELETTNNRMELTAAIKALETLNRYCRVDLFTDAQYLRLGILEWMVNWKKNSWRTADKKPVKNKDLWIKLDQLSKQYDITWHWVKGHTGDPGNEKADELANYAIDEITKTQNATNNS